MQAIVAVVLPVFGIMLAGYLAGRVRLLGAESSQALNAFVFYFALPPLFFLSLARFDGAMLGAAVDFALAFLATLFAVFGIAIVIASLLFPGRLGALALNGMSANFANTGYLGIPLMAVIYGDSAVLPAVLGSLATGVVMMAIGVVLVEADRSAGGSVLAILRRIGVGLLKNPLIMSAVLGVVVRLLDLPVPQPLVRFCEILGASAGPCALFAIGLFMVGKSFTADLFEVLIVVALKLLLMPLIAYWLAFDVFALERFWAEATVILSALPTGALVFVLAQQYEVYVQRATAAIMISTVLSVVTLSIVLVYFGLG